VEPVYLPIWGPSASWLYRKVAVLVDLGLGGIAIDLADLALSLGLGARTGRNSMIAKDGRPPSPSSSRRRSSATGSLGHDGAPQQFYFRRFDLPGQDPGGHMVITQITARRRPPTLADPAFWSEVRTARSSSLCRLWGSAAGDEVLQSQIGQDLAVGRLAADLVAADDGVAVPRGEADAG